MRLSIAVAALMGGLQAASALKLAPRSVAEREFEVSAVCFFHLTHQALSVVAHTSKRARIKTGKQYVPISRDV
jgi:hypothetical protein